MKVHVPLDHEQVDAIIVTSLKESISMLENDLKKYDTGEPWISIFSCDEQEDKKKIKKMIKAMKRCLLWYEVPNNEFEMRLVE